jgi:cell division protein FtsZ
MSLDAVQEAASLIHDSAHDEANIILGAVINPDMEEDVRVTVIATGLEDRVDKADLPQIKKWTPKRDPISLRGSERILSKSIEVYSKEPVKEPEPAQEVTTSLSANEYIKEQEEKDDIYDIPTFLRKKTVE